MEGELRKLTCRNYLLFTSLHWKRRYAMLREGQLHLYENKVSKCCAMSFLL